MQKTIETDEHPGKISKFTTSYRQGQEHCQVAVRGRGVFPSVRCIDPKKGKEECPLFCLLRHRENPTNIIFLIVQPPIDF